MQIYSLVIMFLLFLLAGCTPAPHNVLLSRAGRTASTSELSTSDSLEAGTSTKRSAELDSIRLSQIIDRYIGIPHGSQINNLRFDCSGFVRQVFLDYNNLELPASSASMFKQLPLVKEIKELQFGDLVFFGQGQSVSHVGIFFGGNWFVHASKKCGVTFSSLVESYYQQRYRGARRVIVSTTATR